MKANELRIGNWVYPNDENATPYQVQGIIPNSFGSYIDFGQNLLDKERVRIHEYDLFPIPLTPEILEKCGFDCVSGHYWELLVNIENGYKLLFLISFDNNTMAIEDSHGSIINIKLPESLHQLQNLFFALTGEELNYKL